MAKPVKHKNKNGGGGAGGGGEWTQKRERRESIGENKECWELCEKQKKLGGVFDYQFRKPC